MKTIPLPTGDFLLNAGVVGFLRLWKYICKKRGEYGDKLEVTSEIPVEKLPTPEEMTQYVIDFYNEEYSKEGKVQKAFDALDRLIRNLDEGRPLHEGFGDPEEKSVKESNGNTLFDDNADDPNFVDFAKLKGVLDSIYGALTSNSMKSGVEGISSLIEGVDFYQDFVKNKFPKMKGKTEESEVGPLLKSRLRELSKFCSQPLARQTFLFKNVAYNVVNRFWTDKCFLLRANAKKNIADLWLEDFIRPFYDYIKGLKEAESTSSVGSLFSFTTDVSAPTPIKKGKKGKASKVAIECIACSNPLQRMSDATSIAFMVDVADDLSRKTSPFWNHNVDAFLCPICAFLYSLTPLGFRRIDGDDFLFINSNASIHELWLANLDVKSEVKDAFANRQRAEQDANGDETLESPNSYHARVDAALLTMFQEKKKNLSNIQVILRTKQENGDGGAYQFNVYDRSLMKLLHATTLKDSGQNPKTISDHLTTLSKRKAFKMSNGNYFNVYRHSLDNVLNYRNQYQLLHMLVLESCKPSLGWVRVFLDGVYKIQVLQTYSQLKDQEEESMANEKESISEKLGKWQYFAAEAGRETRQWLLRDAVGSDNVAGLTSEKQEEIVRKVVYPLTNALKTSNVELFTDLIVRIYSSSKSPIPSVFLDALKDENALSLIGYAYVLGIKGALNYKDVSKKEPLQ